MQDERSQHQNRRRAYQVLRSRLLDQKIHKDMAERRAARLNLVSSADRSDKIRTYNFPQVRALTISKSRLLMRALGTSHGPSYWSDVDESVLGARRRGLARLC
jgi:peptide chain release factor 1